jgi:hypothetical protein
MRFLMLCVLLAFGAVASFAQPSATPIKFSELYSTSIRGLEFSPKTQELNGKRIELLGYMAPPLRPRLTFFVLTKTPLAVCPFCSTVADWPPDIVVVYLPKGKDTTSSAYPLRIRGRLELGVKEDPETGFVSLMRIYADEWSEIR